MELCPEGRTGSQCTVCREMGYKLVRDAVGTSERGGEAQPAMEAGGRILERWCRLQWELSSGTHRALPSQSALAGAPPHLLLITNCSVIFSHYHGDDRPSILSSSRMQLDHLSPGLFRLPLFLCPLCLLSFVHSLLIHSLLHPFHSFIPSSHIPHSFIRSFIYSFVHLFPPFLPPSTIPSLHSLWQIGNDGQ